MGNSSTAEDEKNLRKKITDQGILGAKEIAQISMLLILGVRRVLILVMLITGICAFPSLIKPTTISIQQTGVVLKSEFQAPVEKNYLIALRFFFLRQKRGSRMTWLVTDVCPSTATQTCSLIASPQMSGKVWGFRFH